MYEAHVVAMWQCTCVGWGSDASTWLLPVYHVRGTRVDIAVLYYHKNSPSGRLGARQLTASRVCDGALAAAQTHAVLVDSFMCRRRKVGYSAHCLSPRAHACVHCITTAALGPQVVCAWPCTALM